MKKIILTLLLVSICNCLYAFTLSGKITDRGTGLGIPGVSVAVDEIKAVQVTSQDGTFSFQNIPAGYYTVYTAHTEYGNKTVSIRVKRNFRIDIGLSRIEYSIKPVSDSYKKNEVRSGTQSITTDDIKYMPMSGGGDSLHLLQALPGVSSSFSLSGVPVIRGLNPVYDKTYVDDIPVDYPYHYLPPVVPLISSINGTVIDNVALYKGVYPLTFDDSIGSIIHVKTKDVENPGVHGKIILDPVLPLFPTFYCEAAPTADFTLLFAGRRTYVDTAYKIVQVENSDKFYFQDYFLKMRYNFTTDHRFHATLLGSDDYVSVSKYNARTEYHIEEFKWDYLISRDFFLETSLLRNRIEQSFTDKKTASGESPVQIKYYPLTYTLKQTLTNCLHAFAFKNGYEVTVHRDGVSGNADLSKIADYDISELSGSGACISYPIEGKTFSLFNETGVDLYPLHLNLGVRYKHHGPLSSDSVSYRGMASYTVHSRGLKIYGGGGEYHAQPDMYYYLGNNVYRMGESRSYNLILGLEKNLTSGITGQIETYYAGYRDLFTFYTASETSPMLQKLAQINPYSKDKEGSASGAEFFLRGSFGILYGWTSYSLSRSRMSDGETEYCSDYDRTHIFRIALLTRKDGWTPSIVWSYSTSAPYTPITENADGRSADYGTHNSKRYGPYHKLDFKLTYTYRNFRYYAEIRNVYYIKGYNRDDKEFNLNNPYIYPVYQNGSVKNQRDMPGAFLWLGMEICY